MANRWQPVILIIDDDDAIRDLLARLMERLGIETLTAASGEEGVSMFKANKSRISAIMIDAVMPGMDGGEALFEMRRLGARPPAIAVSGQPADEVQRIFEKARPDEILTKPCTIDDLLAILERWHLVPGTELVAAG